MAGTGTLKIAEQIKLIAAEMLARRINDPRLGFVTITEVRLSSDWSVAEIFYTVLGDDAALAASAEALEAAKGQIRTAVAKRVKLRAAPALSFVCDQLPQSAVEFENLLASVRAADAAIAQRSQGASFAGEAQPYKLDETPGE